MLLFFTSTLSVIQAQMVCTFLPFETGATLSLNEDSRLFPDYKTNSKRVLVAKNCTDFVLINAKKEIDIRLEVGPNPHPGRLGYHYSLPVSGEVRLSIFDLSGNETEVLESGWRASGEYAGEWQAKEFYHATSVLCLRVGNRVRAVKLVQ